MKTLATDAIAEKTILILISRQDLKTLLTSFKDPLVEVYYTKLDKERRLIKGGIVSVRDDCLLVYDKEKEKPRKLLFNRIIYIREARQKFVFY